MKLSTTGRIVLALVIALTTLASFAMASVGFQSHLANSKAAGFLLDTILARRPVVLQLGAQILVIVSLYVSYFVVVLMLSRRRRSPRHWIESDPALIFLSWLTLSWLVLRWHNVAFPHSVWVWVMEPIFAREAARLVDLVFATFIGWRILALSVSGFIWTRRFIAVPLRVHLGRWVRSPVLIGLATSLALVIFINLGDLHAAPTKEYSATSPSNVIVIGLDSLRRDALLSTSPAKMPNLHALRQRGFLNSNVVSPLAHTFPAWVTILTGKHPSVSGARTNHAPQDKIDKKASIAWDFKRVGYRTVYATDETRFSHIVPEFGFDDVVGPQKGVSDFLLGQLGDLPLINFFVQLPYTEYLLPSLVGNRAFAHAYHPGSFVSRLRRSIGNADGRPTFLAVHLCTAHWPYYVADQSGSSESGPHSGKFSSTIDEYRAMLDALDVQLGQLLDTLIDGGYLNDRTLLVLLADHGEGLQAESDLSPVIVYHEAAGVLGPPIGGHGTSLLNPDQWKVFVLFSGRSPLGTITKGESTKLASLEDVAPTLRRLTGLRPSSDRRDKNPLEMTELESRPYVLMETGWRPRGFSTTNPDGRAALRIAETSYVVASDGRVELKASAYEEAIQGKDIGITDGMHSLITFRTPERDLLVAQDLERRQWDVYPIEPSSDQDSDHLPLIKYACAEPEVRSRIAKWCARGGG